MAKNHAHKAIAVERVGLKSLLVEDPCDGALSLSVASDKVEGGAAPTRWQRAWPLAGLALAAVVNVLWGGVLGYALFKLLLGISGNSSH